MAFRALQHPVSVCACISSGTSLDESVDRHRYCMLGALSATANCMKHVSPYFDHRQKTIASVGIAQRKSFELRSVTNDNSLALRITLTADLFNRFVCKPIEVYAHRNCTVGCDTLCDKFMKRCRRSV